MHVSYLLLILALCGFLLHFGWKSKNTIVPVSVNYHFTRKCNYECGFCFHTAKTSNIATLDDAKRALRLLKSAGMKKINFAGGEPFLHAKFLGELVKFCKVDLKLESVSIVSNGSKISEDWIEKYATFLDILAISCDSFDENTNKLIGRSEPGNTGTQHISKVRQIASWCDLHNIRFKINTVVNRFNFMENMNEEIRILAPFRWKCFQVLVVQGENDSDEALRNASKFLITDEEFQSFCERHENNMCFVPEPNNLMRNSYLIIDENLCFLNHTGEATTSSKSVLDVGVQAALREAGWDERSFMKRGGIYDWTKRAGEPAGGGCGSGERKELEW